jgi:hypothetical protein
MKTLYFFAALVILTAAGCSPKIYTSPAFTAALAKHKTVAILPAEVKMQLRPNQMRNTTQQQLNEMAMKTGYDIQEKMYGWFLRMSDRKDYTVTFQDVTRTNALLKEAGIQYADLITTDRAKLAKMLGVDAVIQDRTSMEKPMSEEAALVVGLMTNTWGSTNKVNTTINIHDGTSGDLLWKYDYEASGSIGSSSTRLVDALMKKASKKFPYSSK